jgi:hypothetical protein
VTAEVEDPDIKKLKGSLDFVHKRFAKFIQIINANIEVDLRDKLLETLGRECGQDSLKHFETYKNNLDDFLVYVKKDWAEKAEYDKESKTIKIIGKKLGRCFCPLVNKDLTPKNFCNCSLGWQKQVFEFLSGRPVKRASVQESFLRGGERCSFIIKLA